MNNTNGNVLLHRQFYDLDVFRSPLETSVFLYIYADAAWQEQERRLDDRTRCTLSRGETVASERDLADKFGLHRNTVSRLLKRLEGVGMLCSRKAPGRASNGTIWTIVKYEEYQSFNWYHTEDVGHPEGDAVSVAVAGGVADLSLSNPLNTENPREDSCAISGSGAKLPPIEIVVKAKAVEPDAQYDLVDLANSASQSNGDPFGDEDLFGRPAPVQAKPADKTPRKPAVKKSTDDPTPIEAEKFEKFWEIYPDRGGDVRKLALEAFVKALRRGAVFEEIMTGVRNYTARNQDIIGQRGIAMASTFLNQDRWENHQTAPSPAERQAASGGARRYVPSRPAI